MTYQDFVHHLVELLTVRMSPTTAGILIEEFFPMELSELWESHLELSDKFLIYAEKILDGE